MNLFEALGLKPELVTAVTELGFAQPTPIQQQAIPALLEDSRDLVATAQTGTGKTAAFGLPLLHRIDEHSKHSQALILCPTRELCLQITKDLRDYAKHIRGLHIVPVYGGASISVQLSELRRGAQVVVGTPGRMLDIIGRKGIKLGEVSTVVLDEADEMLSMGFRDDIEEILSETSEEKNTWLFSATMPREVRAIAERFMSDPLRLSAGEVNKAAENISHQYYVVHSRDRYPALRRIIDYHPGLYGIVFCRTKAETQEIADHLIRDGYTADALHGDLSQAQRDFVMKRFRSRTVMLLVATDVAARGIDVDQISHVIHYSLPDEPEVYTHRSGRTARAGHSGISAVIVGMKEMSRVRQIEKIISKRMERVMVPGAQEICAQQAVALIDKLMEEPEHASAIATILPSAISTLAEVEKEELIERMLLLLLGERLKVYQNAPDLNVVTGSSAKGQKEGHAHPQGDFKRFFISLGRMDGFEKADMLRYFCEMLKTDRSAIGRMDIQNSFSFVEVAGINIPEVLSAFENKNYRGRAVRVDLSEKREDEGGFRKKDFHGKKGGKDFYPKREGKGFYPKKNGEKSYGKKSGGGYQGNTGEKKSYGDRPDKFRKIRKK
ncbi:MAG: DNA/RNA helicase [Bacteroidetes bacterium]|nr:MAG: DNA/RNA helicase [Bacteroidota bacterium]